MVVQSNIIADSFSSKPQGVLAQWQSKDMRHYRPLTIIRHYCLSINMRGYHPLTKTRYYHLSTNIIKHYRPLIMEKHYHLSSNVRCYHREYYGSPVQAQPCTHQNFTNGNGTRNLRVQPWWVHAIGAHNLMGCMTCLCILDGRTIGAHDRCVQPNWAHAIQLGAGPQLCNCDLNHILLNARDRQIV